MYRIKLLEMGVPANNLGFEYLNYAIENYHPGMKMILLYDEVASKFETTQSRAERAMRNASKRIEDINLGAFIAKYKILWSESE